MIMTDKHVLCGRVTCHCCEGVGTRGTYQTAWQLDTKQLPHSAYLARSMVGHLAAPLCPVQGYAAGGWVKPEVVGGAA